METKGLLIRRIRQERTDRPYHAEGEKKARPPEGGRAVHAWYRLEVGCLDPYYGVISTAMVVTGAVTVASARVAPTSPPCSLK